MNILIVQRTDRTDCLISAWASWTAFYKHFTDLVEIELASVANGMVMVHKFRSKLDPSARYTVTYGPLCE